MCVSGQSGPRTGHALDAGRLASHVNFLKQLTYNGTTHGMGIASTPGQEGDSGIHKQHDAAIQTVAAGAKPRRNLVLRWLGESRFLIAPFYGLKVRLRMRLRAICSRTKMSDDRFWGWLPLVLGHLSFSIFRWSLNNPFATGHSI